MELIGEEKKIQELFRELRVEDERLAPRFVTVWNQTLARAHRPSRLFRLVFVAATVLLAFALFSLPWWSKHWPSTQQRNELVTKPPAPTVSPLAPVRSSEPKELVADDKRHPNRRPRSVNFAARQRQAGLLAARLAAIRDAAAISKWQSPTVTLLRSSSDAVFTSLPQLNESANELRSFLPARDN